VKHSKPRKPCTYTPYLFKEERQYTSTLPHSLNLYI